MKIIDWERKGNVVRLYLGQDSLKEWEGDDWDDKPYEDNAGRVYNQYISDKYDIKFDFDDIVCEPCNCNYPEMYCKLDFIDKSPFLVILKSKYVDEDFSYRYNYSTLLGDKNSMKIYLGDDLDKTIKKLELI